MASLARLAAVLLASLGLLLTACGDDDDDAGADDTTEADTSADGTSDTTRDDAFDSDQIIEDFEYVLQPVQAGTEISFVNLDSAPHTLTAEDGSFDSGTVDGGESITFDSPAPGEYDVFCTIHPDVTGTLVVEE